MELNKKTINLTTSSKSNGFFFKLLISNKIFTFFCKYFHKDFLSLSNF